MAELCKCKEPKLVSISSFSIYASEYIDGKLVEKKIEPSPEGLCGKCGEIIPVNKLMNLPEWRGENKDDKK